MGDPGMQMLDIQRLVRITLHTMVSVRKMHGRPCRTNLSGVTTSVATCMSLGIFIKIRQGKLWSRNEMIDS